jgi:diacylglycerol kinase family enzyme
MNPSSRSGKGRSLWDKWLYELESLNIDHEAFVSDSIDHCVKLAQENNGFNVAVAVGGDGTINAVLNGVVKNSNKEIQLGVLYAGTSPDFCNFHKIDIKPSTAVRSLIESKCKKIDLVEIEHRDKYNNKTIAYFACSCNIGMGQDVAETANRIRRYMGDRLGTGLALTKNIIKGKKYNFKMKIGEEEFSFENANHLTILKNPLIASGLKLGFELTPDDRQLGVWALSGFSRMGMLKLFPKFYNGEASHDAKGIFKRITTKNVELSEPAGLGIEFDGDHHGYLPVKARIADKKINLRGSTI